MVYPEYYPQFHCIADACKHTCCQGWEIDVDNETAAAILAVSAQMGDKWSHALALSDGIYHFSLDACERCPFLTERNLCELILSNRADLLPEICNEHPRFYNRINGRCEVGLGLCCEEAARLILGWCEPVRLIDDGLDGTLPEVVARDAMIAQLQDRSRTLDQRLSLVATGETGDAWQFDPVAWCERLLELEIMDETWKTLLERFSRLSEALPIHAFCNFMRDRAHEYEQLAVYLVYRYALNDGYQADLATCGRLAAWGVMLVGALGAMLWQETGDFSFADQVELVRLFSAEIEYSEENMDEILYDLANGI